MSSSSEDILKDNSDEKRVFKNRVISVISAAKGAAGALYAHNLSLSLSKETNRGVILIKIPCGANELPALNLGEADFSGGSAIKDAIIKETDSGINILNIACDSSENNVCASNINSLLSFLAGNFNFIVIGISALMNTGAFDILGQSDAVHLVTDYDTKSLQETKILISELSRRVNYPQDRIKVIVNADIISKIFSCEEVSGLLGFKIYAMLPGYLGRASKIILEDPRSEYARAVRRIAREAGDVRVGLALSGGAAFGLAQIGVIKVLESEDIPIDAIAGSSIGALIGALWACGLNSEELKKIVLGLNNKKKVFRLLLEPHFPRLSFSKGRRLRNFLEQHIGRRTFQDTRFPLRIVACNLTKRQEFVYDSGSLVDAVIASIAIPGVFTPVKTNGDLVVDGGIINPVPISVLAKMGIKKIIAVNVFPSPQDVVRSNEFESRRMEEEKRQAESKGFLAKIAHNLAVRFNKMFFPNILDIIVNSIQILEFVIAEKDCRKANIVIRPAAVGVEWLEFFKAEELIKKGEEETKNSLAALKSLIRE